MHTSKTDRNRIGGIFQSKHRQKTLEPIPKNVTHPFAPDSDHSSGLHITGWFTQQDLFTQDEQDIPGLPAEVLVYVIVSLSRCDLLVSSSITAVARGVVDEIAAQSSYLHTLLPAQRLDLQSGNDMHASAIYVVEIMLTALIAHFNNNPLTSESQRMQFLVQFLTGSVVLPSGEKRSYVAPSDLFFSALAHNIYLLIQTMCSDMWQGEKVVTTRGLVSGMIPSRIGEECDLLSFANMRHIKNKLHDPRDVFNQWVIAPMVGNTYDPSYQPKVSFLIEYYIQRGSDKQVLQRTVTEQLRLLYVYRLAQCHYMIVTPELVNDMKNAYNHTESENMRTYYAMYTAHHTLGSKARVRISYVPQGTILENLVIEPGNSFTDLPEIHQRYTTIPLFITAPRVQAVLRHLGCNLWCHESEKWICALLDYIPDDMHMTLPRPPALTGGGDNTTHRDYHDHLPHEPVPAMVLVAIVKLFYETNWNTANDYSFDVSAYFIEQTQQDTFKKWKKKLCEVIHMQAYSGQRSMPTVLHEVDVLVKQFFDLIIAYENGPLQRTMGNLISMIIKTNSKDVTLESLFCVAHQQDYSAFITAISRFADKSHNTKLAFGATEILPLFFLPENSKGVFVEIAHTDFHRFTLSNLPNGGDILSGSEFEIPILKITQVRLPNLEYHITRAGATDPADTIYTICLRQYPIQECIAAEYTISARATNYQVAEFLAFIGFGLSSDSTRPPDSNQHLIHVYPVDGHAHHHS